MGITCRKCGAGAEFALCWACQKKLLAALTTLREVIPELENQITRQVKGAPVVGRSSRTSKLPFDAAASESADVVINTLAAWCEKPPEGLSSVTADRTKTAALLVDWHLCHYILLSRRDDAAVYADEIHTALRYAMTAVDRRPEKVIVGRCRCGTALVAQPDLKDVECRICAATYAADDLRRSVQQRTHDARVTARQAQALIGVRAGTVRKWCERGRLQSVGVDLHTSEMLFRLGDLQRLRLGGSRPEREYLQQKL